MEKLDQSPYFSLEFDKANKPLPGSLHALSDVLKAANPTDVVVMSHGWKNSPSDAKLLYSTLWGNTPLTSQLKQNTLVIGVVWHAKEYGADFDDVPAERNKTQSTGTSVGISTLDEERLSKIFDQFQDFFEDRGLATLDAARQTANQGFAEGRPKQLFEAAKELVAADNYADDIELGGVAKDIRKAAGDPDQAALVLQSLATPPIVTLPATGGAQGLGNTVIGLVHGTGAAVARFLNQLTYFEMKKRAGEVGVVLVQEILSHLTSPSPFRLHLVGHSFGGRLVTAAANAWSDTPSARLSSLTLLQAAYSHNGFAQSVGNTPGAFRAVIGKVHGPIVITHTHRDSACTIAYPLASRLSNDIAAALGGPDDKYGAMGANGPQLLPADAVMLHQSLPSALVSDKLNSVLADAFITEHNDVKNASCGKILALAVG